MQPDQLLALAGLGLAGAYWISRNHHDDFSEAVPPPVGPRSFLYDMWHPMREPTPLGNRKFDMYEKHIALRAMSGGFKTTVMAQLLRERLRQGRSCVVMTGGDSAQLETEIRAWGGYVIRPHDSPFTFNAFEGRPSYIAQGWAGLFPTNTDAKVYHSAFEIVATRYFESRSRYSVLDMMKFMLTYDPDKDVKQQVELEDGEKASMVNGRLWKGMKEGYVGIRLQLMHQAFGHWLGDQLSILDCVQRKIPIMVVTDSADDPDLNRFASALVWQAINYAVRQRGDIDVFVDELGRLPLNLVGDQIRTWRFNKSHLIVGSHKDSDFNEVLEDLIHVQLLGTMVASAGTTRSGAQEKTWGQIHATNFGAHVLGQEWTRGHALLRRPRQGKFWMVDLERVQQVTINAYQAPKWVLAPKSMKHLYATSKKVVPTSTGLAVTQKSHASPLYLDVVTLPIVGDDVGGYYTNKYVAGPPRTPLWVGFSEHTQSLWNRVYFTERGALDPQACHRIRLSLKGQGGRPGLKFLDAGPGKPSRDWKMYGLVLALNYAAEQGMTREETYEFLQYVKLHQTTGALSGDHLCEEWMGAEARLCIRVEHLQWKSLPDNTSLHWQRWWNRKERARLAAAGGNG